jgi:hypothetical protein
MPSPPPVDESTLPPGGEPEARRLVCEVTGATAEPIKAFFLSPPDGKKNAVVSYVTDEGKFVLKIYRQDVRYTVQAMKNVVPRYFTRAFTVRSLAPARVRAELAGIAGFREAGFQTFEVVERPRRDALVFRNLPGADLKTILRERADPQVARAFVERVARDLARRQAIALERRDLRMVHPSPRVQHVWVQPDGSFVYYDFEDRVNPGLRIERALANEVECFFFYLLRLEETADPATIALAREALDGAPMQRWRDEREKRRGWRFSGSARRRRGVYPAVLDARL